jgi:hypothetical protein
MSPIDRQDAAMPVNVTVQETPNPEARRFVVDQPVQDESRGRFFTSADQAAEEPLAQRLLTADGVTAVLLLPTSVTVTKDAGASWDDVESTARDIVTEHFG